MATTADRQQHWNRAYSSGDAGKGWFQPHAQTSLQLIRSALPDLSGSIVEVGGGSSTLIDGLLAVGYGDLTVVDVSEQGMDIARKRVGSGETAVAAAQVEWLVADVLSWRPPRSYGVWHERAVLHFLLEDSEREHYRETLLAATHTGSALVIGGFGPEGPEICSGLQVRRLSVAEMVDFLEPDFEVVDSRLQIHVTPSGGEQQFLWTSARRVSNPQLT